MIATDEKLQEVLTYCIDFAQLMLRDAGEFYPFGSTVDQSGAVQAVGGHLGEDRPSPRDIYALLVGSFESQAADGTIVAAGLVANVDIPEEYSPTYRDGIRVHIERSGWARFIYVPYRVSSKGIFRRTWVVDWAEPISVEVPPQFFLTLVSA